MWLKILKFSSLIILAASILGVAVLGVNFHFSEAQTVGYDISGWLRSDNYGWISLNSANCEAIGDPAICSSTGVSYGVVVNSNNISGWGWSEHVGWVCFGETCTGTAPSGGWVASLDEDTGKITGWAKILSLGDDGWLKLRSGPDTGNRAEGQDCYGCAPHCIVWTQVESESGPVDTEPCLEYDDEIFDNCQTCFT